MSRFNLTQSVIARDALTGVGAEVGLTGLAVAGMFVFGTKKILPAVAGLISMSDFPLNAVGSSNPITNLAQQAISGSSPSNSGGFSVTSPPLPDIEPAPPLVSTPPVAPDVTTQHEFEAPVHASKEVLPQPQNIFSPVAPEASGLPALPAPPIIDPEMSMRMPWTDSFMVYVRPNDNVTVGESSLSSPYASQMTEADLAGVTSQAGRMLEMMKLMSAGPYTSRDLRLMGHPYGYDEVDDKKVPRKVGRYGRAGNRVSIGHPKGVRGSVPTMNVINSQSGDLQHAWQWGYELTPTGISVKFWNDSLSANQGPKLWWLTAGTKKMQPHSPVWYVAQRMLPDLEREWRKATQEAQSRQQMRERMLETAV